MILDMHNIKAKKSKFRFIHNIKGVTIYIFFSFFCKCGWTDVFLIIFYTPLRKINRLIKEIYMCVLFSNIIFPCMSSFRIIFGFTLLIDNKRFPKFGIIIILYV